MKERKIYKCQWEGREITDESIEDISLSIRSKVDHRWRKGRDKWEGRKRDHRWRKRRDITVNEKEEISQMNQRKINQCQWEGREITDEWTEQISCHWEGREIADEGKEKKALSMKSKIDHRWRKGRDKWEGAVWWWWTIDVRKQRNKSRLTFQKVTGTQTWYPGKDWGDLKKLLLVLEKEERSQMKVKNRYHCQWEGRDDDDEP